MCIYAYICMRVRMPVYVYMYIYVRHKSMFDLIT